LCVAEGSCDMSDVDEEALKEDGGLVSGTAAPVDRLERAADKLVLRGNVKRPLEVVRCRPGRVSRGSPCTGLLEELDWGDGVSSIGWATVTAGSCIDNGVCQQFMR
jgi:hypothetical protein